MKMRQRARRLKQRQAFRHYTSLTPRGPREPLLTMMRKLQGLTLPQVIDAMTDAELNQVLEEGKRSGLYETFRRMKQ